MNRKRPFFELGHDLFEFQYWIDFLSDNEADALFSELLEKVHWKKQVLSMYGKQVPMPRLTAWYGDEGSAYKYSGIKNEPLPWLPSLARLRRDLSSFVKAEFNSVLLNYYRNGEDSLSWHRDDELELGSEPVIASISLGASRYFNVKEDPESGIKFRLQLTSGSLLVMRGMSQSGWLHSIPKSNSDEARINLTFRFVGGGSLQGSLL